MLTLQLSVWSGKKPVLNDQRDKVVFCDHAECRPAIHDKDRVVLLQNIDDGLHIHIRGNGRKTGFSVSLSLSVH